MGYHTIQWRRTLRFTIIALMTMAVALIAFGQVSYAADAAYEVLKTLTLESGPGQERQWRVVVYGNRSGTFFPAT